ncbi:MAG: lipid-binding SYLF domain-containing protein [bacterium]|nr:lipid-binding SYLF domain-containing protein [bacterium]
MKRLFVAILILGVVLIGLGGAGTAQAATKGEIDRDVEAALENLYKSSPGAKELGKQAKGILVFPKVLKGGFIFGGQYGEGALLKNGETAGYYNTVAASYGLQIGAQVFGYALFFMSDEDLAYVEGSSGWEIGSGPTVVVADAGMAGAFTTTTVRKGVYAFFFSQKGLMAGLGLQGTKISKMKRP